MGRLDSKTAPVATVDYGYDNNGNLTKLIYPDSKEVDYDYNAHNQLIKITDWNSRETDYSYDLKGRLTSISRPNGTVRSLQYDAADQVTRIEERKADGSLILLFSFQYDQVGRITEEFAGPLPKEYTPETYTATYDADNRLATFNGNPVFHDNDGNMTVGPLLDDTLKTYSYDARNRLKSVGGITYAYDAEGNRISSTKASGTTSYAIDPNTGLSKLLVRTKPDGSKTYYVYGMGLVYEVDESENTLSYHYDYRGSTRFLTDDSESVTDTVEYSPYGLVTHRTGTSDTPFLYNGAFGVMAEANGLYHMRARFYNPYTRRFVNADPIKFEASMNWFAYTDNDPVNFNDPVGLDRWVVDRIHTSIVVEEWSSDNSEVVGYKRIEFGPYADISSLDEINRTLISIAGIIVTAGVATPGLVNVNDTISSERPESGFFTNGAIYTRHIPSTPEADRALLDAALQANTKRDKPITDGLPYSLWGGNCRNFTDAVCEFGINGEPAKLRPILGLGGGVFSDK